MEYKEISMEDRNLFKDIPFICSDYAFSYLYMFADAYKIKIYHDDNSIIIRSGSCHPIFYMPLGDTSSGIRTALNYCRTKKIKPVFAKIPEEYIHFFSDYNLKIAEDRNSFDYIFRKSDLVEYEGSKYRNQRNNMSNYLKTNTPYYSSDIKPHIDECRDFTLKFYGKKKDVLNPTNRILDRFDEFGLMGGIVWDNDTIQAFCVYEKVSDNFVLSHVELTNNSHRGVHAYMINEMSKMIDTEFINKEDDMGLAGLRRFKESYNPCNLLKKYTASMETA